MAVLEIKRRNKVNSTVIELKDQNKIGKASD